MKKIYVNSQFFGYGPTSNLFGILKSLKSKSSSFEICAIKNEAMELFAAKQPEIIDQWSKEAELLKADVILSCFDPFSIVTGWFYNIPTVFYCNLFWYWDVFKKKEIMIKHKNFLCQFKSNKDFLGATREFTRIFNNNSHEGIFLGYMLSTNSFTRNFSGIDNLAKIYKDEINIFFSQIYIPYQLQESNNIKKNIIIQLSGSRNSIVTDEENAWYMHLCIQLAKHVAKTYTKLNVSVCINPIILSQLDLLKENTPSNMRIIPSVSYNENLKMIEQALVIFTSPGLETIYEAIYCKCPIFLLPEQNAGQYSIFQLLNKAGYTPDRFLVNELFPGRYKLCGEEDAHEIYKIIKNNILNSPKNLNHLFKKSLLFIDKMMKEEEKSKYLKMSEMSLKSSLGDTPFTDVEIISDFIIKSYT